MTPPSRFGPATHQPRPLRYGPTTALPWGSGGAVSKAALWSWAVRFRRATGFGPRRRCRRTVSMSCAVNDRPLAFPVVVLAVAKHKRSFGRFEVATVEDPEVPDSGCTLSVIVRTGEFKPQDTAVLLLIGTRVPEDLARQCGWEGLLAENDFVLKPYYFGRGYLSNGLLLPWPEEFGASPLDSRSTGPLELTSFLKLRSAEELDKISARSFMIEIGFDGSFHGSQSSGCDDLRPTVLGKLLKVLAPLDARDVSSGSAAPDHEPRPKRMSQWVALSRVDAGVRGRSFKVTTPPLLCRGSVDITEALAKLPSSIALHRVIPMPRGVELSPAFEIAREYGYYLPAAILGDSSATCLDGILQDFCGSHCFGNFTDIKKLEGLKKKIRRSVPLQRFAHSLQSWKRSRRAPKADGIGWEGWNDSTPVSSIPMHPDMRAACKRHVLSIAVDVRRGGTDDTQLKGLICIRVKGYGFLYNMIRYLVGSAVAVATGKLSSDVLATAIEGSICIDLSEFLAPAHGLVLLDQSLDSFSWASQASEVAAHSADEFLDQRLLPEIQKEWEDWQPKAAAWMRSPVQSPCT